VSDRHLRQDIAPPNRAAQLNGLGRHSNWLVAGTWSPSKQPGGHSVHVFNPSQIRFSISNLAKKAVFRRAILKNWKVCAVTTASQVVPRGGIAQSLHYTWSKEFMEASKRRRTSALAAPQNRRVKSTRKRGEYSADLHRGLRQMFWRRTWRIQSLRRTVDICTSDCCANAISR